MSIIYVTNVLTFLSANPRNGQTHSNNSLAHKGLNDYAPFFVTHFKNSFLRTSFDQILMQTYQGLIQKERVDLAGERGGQMCRLATEIIKDDPRVWLWSPNKLIICAIWYHLYNLKSMKNSRGGVILLVKLQAELSFLHWCFASFLNCY